MPLILIQHVDRQDNSRDSCCCCIKLSDSYSESECGKKDNLQEFFGKYIAPVFLSLPGKVCLLKSHVDLTFLNTSKRKQVQERKTSFGNPSFGLKTSLIFRLNNISTLIQILIMLKQFTSAVVYKELQVSRGFQAFKVINKEIQYD